MNQAPQKAGIFIQNSEELADRREPTNLVSTQQMTSINEQLKKAQVQSGAQYTADQSILSTGSIRSKDQDFSHYLNLNDLTGLSSGPVLNSKMITLEDHQLLAAGASFESRQVQLKHILEDEQQQHQLVQALNRKPRRNVKTQGASRRKGGNQGGTQQNVPNIHTFRQSLPQREGAQNSDLLQAFRAETNPDFFGTSDGGGSLEGTRESADPAIFSPLSVRGFKQPLSPLHGDNMNLKLRHNKSPPAFSSNNFIHISTPPEGKRDTQEDNIFEKDPQVGLQARQNQYLQSTREIIKSTNRINLRGSQQNYKEVLRNSLNPNADLGKQLNFKGIRLQSMDEKNSTEHTNIVSKTFSAYKPISSHHMTIDVKSLNASRDSRAREPKGVQTKAVSKS